MSNEASAARRGSKVTRFDRNPDNADAERVMAVVELARKPADPPRRAPMVDYEHYEKERKSPRSPAPNRPGP